MTWALVVLLAACAAMVAAPLAVAARRITDVHRTVPDARPLPPVPVTVEARVVGDDR